jgi:sigma-B regulation protein RsbU (phosphoserine phosphatase)
MFVTVFYGIYDLQTGLIQFTNAGHNPPYILRADGQVEALQSPCNLVLGAVEGMPFSSDTLQLNQGDTLFMYTDGVTEAENKNHDQFGESRLEATLAQLKGAVSKDIVSTVNAKVKEFIDGAAQSDDITQLVIRRK